jgi:DNA-nicking Smr family endonuclease
MPRRKKRKTRVPKQKALKKESGSFNPAFKPLASLMQDKKPDLNKVSKNTGAKTAQDRDKAESFLEAMRDVTPLSPNKNKIIRASNIGAKPRHRARDEELEVLAHLSDLVSGSIDMDITFSDEYIEGSVQGFSRKLMERLKKGLFPIQDYIDLHGLTRHEAEVKVRDFLLRSYRLVFWCVLVVQGRGLNSENHIPILKELLPAWLSRGPIKKIVLAFSTSRPYDGGTGAIYILLRRRRGAL